MRISRIASGLGLVALVACQSTNLTVPRGHHQNGEYQAAADAMKSIVPIAVDEGGAPYHKARKAADNLWLVLEDGKYQIDAGLWEDARLTMREALAIMEGLEEEATISLGAVQSGAEGIAVDDRQSDYIGTTYDRILVPAYLALCELMLGNYEEASVAARKMQQWQQAAGAARTALGGQQAGEVAAARDQGVEFDRDDFASAIPVNADDVHAAYKNNRAGVASWATPATSDYSIPAAQFIGAVAHGAAGNVSEMSRMLTSVRRNSPKCQEVRELSVRPGKVIVLFETGGVPYRVDDSVWFDYSYTKDGKPAVSLVKVSVPALAYEGKGSRPGLEGLVSNEEDQKHFRSYQRVSGLTVKAGGREHKTQVLGSLSGLVALEFEEALPGIWFREIARVIIREVLQAEASGELAEEHGEAGMFASMLGGALIKSGFEPDLRGWESLPAEHQLVILDAPADGKLEFLLPDESLPAVVLEDVSKDAATLVFARSSRPGTLQVHSAPLGPRP